MTDGLSIEFSKNQAEGLEGLRLFGEIRARNSNDLLARFEEVLKLFFRVGPMGAELEVYFFILKGH